MHHSPKRPPGGGIPAKQRLTSLPHSLLLSCPAGSLTFYHHRRLQPTRTRSGLRATQNDPRSTPGGKAAAREPVATPACLSARPVLLNGQFRSMRHPARHLLPFQHLCAFLGLPPPLPRQRQSRSQATSLCITCACLPRQDPPGVCAQGCCRDHRSAAGQHQQHQHQHQHQPIRRAV
jgi:hypothetical protein